MSTPAIIPPKPPRKGRQKHGPDPWNPAETSKRSTIAVIEPSEPRAIPTGARSVPFGFARALVEEGSCKFLKEPTDDWAEHAAMLVG